MLNIDLTTLLLIASISFIAGAISPFALLVYLVWRVKME